MMKLHPNSKKLALVIIAVSFFASSALAKAVKEDSELIQLRADAKQGDANAELSLGTAYHLGNGVKQDDAEAVKWWQKAAAQGNTLAELLLGDALSEGKGIARNDAQAIGWWYKAANQGNADAQNNLGTAYHNGVGTPQNSTEAVKWWRKAAEQGGIDVELSLGAAFYNGDGVPKDKVLAAKWFKLAAMQDKEAAPKLLEEVEASMTQAEIIKAESLASQWQQQHAAVQSHE